MPLRKTERKEIAAHLEALGLRRGMKVVVHSSLLSFGDVEGRTCVVVDDIVDTAGTLTEAARALRDAGASAVSAAITHPVLSGPAIKRISESPIADLVVTDSVPLSDEAKASEKLHVVSIAPLLSEAIRRINNEESVSSLFV